MAGAASSPRCRALSIRCVFGKNDHNIKGQGRQPLALKPAGRFRAAKACQAFRCHVASVRSTGPPFLKGEAMKSNPEVSAVGPPRRRKVYSRPSLLDRVTLADGRLAWPVAKAAGVHEVTFRSRLSAGVSPDDAVRPVERVAMPGGRTVAAAARASGLSPLTVRKRLARGVPVQDAARPVDRPRLADGRLAWPVAKATGVSSATFWYRLRKAGWSPDEAVKPVARRSSSRPPQA